MTVAIVCGGRFGRDFFYVYWNLQRLHKERRFKLLKFGGAPGYDTLGLNAAIMLGIPYRIYRADWDAYPKAAGPIRNRRMLTEDEPVDVTVAFPGSRGTNNMIEQSKHFNIPVIKVDPSSITFHNGWQPHFHIIPSKLERT